MCLISNINLHFIGFNSVICVTFFYTRYFRGKTKQKSNKTGGKEPLLIDFGEDQKKGDEWNDTWDDKAWESLDNN